MSEPLTLADLERMRAEHVPRTWSNGDIYCNACTGEPAEYLVDFPCDTVVLLVELKRRVDECMDCAAKYGAPRWLTTKPRPEFGFGATGIAYGLLGPVTNEELT